MSELGNIHFHFAIMLFNSLVVLFKHKYNFHQGHPLISSAVSYGPRTCAFVVS